MPIAMGMANVFKPRCVKMGANVVATRLMPALRAMRMWHHRQLTGKVSEQQKGGGVAADHQQFPRATIAPRQGCGKQMLALAEFSAYPDISSSSAEPASGHHFSIVREANNLGSTNRDHSPVAFSDVSPRISRSRSNRLDYLRVLAGFKLQGRSQLAQK